MTALKSWAIKLFIALSFTNEIFPTNHYKLQKFTGFAKGILIMVN